MNVVPASKYVVITDVNVWKHHGDTLQAAFAETGLEPLVKVLPDGEASKCRAVKAEIEDWMLSNG